ncbi:glucokinase [Rhodoblastus sphagnicola]|uniref:Glucokinase n=1 Tax=Rhodoblastus sphagnicola TaxID=333368 RepID=A0A2S6MUC1_9HYPH|nr:glucokinase [Rhodoblastus sphagnicola]MBB4197036.1 glucokinase [Rhodoblastus sphagnicola]PPQ25963.1 glucokinase [Rhodoblastus sphagnicola]
MIANGSNEEIIAVADIGGTNARFALARVGRDASPELGQPVVLRTADFPDLASAFAAFIGGLDGARPKRGSFALACPIRGETLKFTNNPWTLRPATLAADLGLDEVRLLNDFGAVAHAAAKADLSNFTHICGPNRPPPRAGVISILGPGTGLGVVQLIRDGAAYRVVETEGGHIDFAPHDAFEDGLLARLREKFGRVSVERVLSGPGLAEILLALPGAPAQRPADPALWAAAISGADALARAALQKFCLCLGAVAGDLALVHGAEAVILAGGLAPRIASMLTALGFADRFRAKGRYREMMTNIPVWMIAHPQPGLFGAAAAFQP